MYYKIEQLKNILASHKNCVFSLDHLCSSALEYIQHLEAGIDRCYELAKRVESAQPKWISVEERLPDVCDLVLVIANGQPKENIKLHDAVLIASYWGEEGWIADGFDGWDKLNVTFWMPLPEPPKEEKG